MYCVIKEIQKVGGFNSAFSEKDRKGIWELKFDYDEFLRRAEFEGRAESGQVSESVRQQATQMLAAYR